MRRLTAALLTLALVLAACGDDADEADAPGTTGTEMTGTSGVPDTTGTTEPPGEDELPGERVEIFPYEDAELAVVGVAADETLVLRSGPGAGFEAIAELGPLADGLVATGHNRSLDDAGLWSEVTVDGETGWAETACLLQLGQVNDLTSALFPTPADRPSAETMLELAEAVAGLRASEEPASRVVVVDGPTVGDLGEVTVDVVGLGDDALGGERLVVFGQPGPSGEDFTVRTVEATLLCSRGVTADGLCV